MRFREECSGSRGNRVDPAPHEVDPGMGFAMKLVLLDDAPGVSVVGYECGHCGERYAEDPGVMCRRCGWAFGSVEEAED